MEVDRFKSFLKLKNFDMDLIQLRHNYALPSNVERFGQVYMPTSLLTTAARLVEAGIDIKIYDENINPSEVFQSLDFTALPSELTHPDEKLRGLATKRFLDICSIPGNTTKYVKLVE